MLSSAVIVNVCSPSERLSALSAGFIVSLQLPPAFTVTGFEKEVPSSVMTTDFSPYESEAVPPRSICVFLKPKSAEWLSVRTGGFLSRSNSLTVTPLMFPALS